MTTVAENDFPRKLRHGKEKQDSVNDTGKKKMVGMVGKAFRISTDLVSGVFVGLAIGYGIDTFFSSFPWGIVIFFILGSMAGFRNVFKTVQEWEKIGKDDG